MKLEISYREHEILVAAMQVFRRGSNSRALGNQLRTDSYVSDGELSRLERKLVDAEFEDELDKL